MQQQAGGLPEGFTELEYLESSGTQLILTGIDPDGDTGWGLVHQSVSSGLNFPMGLWRSFAGFTLRYSTFYAPANRMTLEFAYNTAPIQKYEVSPEIYGGKISSSVNWRNSKMAICQTAVADALFPLNVALELSYSGKAGIDMPLFVRCSQKNGSYEFYACKIFQMKISQGEEGVRDFVPALDADGTPCMYDKISKQCFYNLGSGTFGYRIKTSGETIAPFARRDPYYTAPSGVYARLIAENTLDIIADTDISPDAAEQAGYTWHPNIGDAYTAYNITPSPEITA